MSMSEHAKMQDLLTPFRDHYHNRDRAGRKANAQGMRVMGRTSFDVPVEPILAAGFFPLMLTADLARATPLADHYVDPELPGETRILFETIAGGDYEFLDLLILARAQDKLYYFLKEVYRLGRAPKMPALMMYDIMPSLRDSVSAYNRNRYAAFLERLTRLSHGRLTEESLRQASLLTNQIRGLQRHVQDLRLHGQMKGSDALHVIGAGSFMALEDYASALAHLLKHVPTSAPSAKPGSGLLIVSAEPIRFTQVHELIEELGGHVMAEDDAWGSRAAGADISLEGPISQAIFEKYTVHSPGPDSFPAEKREGFLKTMAAHAQIGGVIFYVPPSDRKLGWDLPRLTTMIHAMGMPCVSLFKDLAKTNGAQQIRQDLQSFLSQHPSLMSHQGK